ncbi:MAG: hypothetical protein LH472_04270 [Pyrinomonadaceae bacterium]|nr:hypothetical protein [Pyrinomonadaceae bacterium]
MSGAAAAFNGSSGDLGCIVSAFGLVILISRNAAAAGIRQTIFGKCSKPLAIIVLVLGIAFLGTGLAAALMK